MYEYVLQAAFNLCSKLECTENTWYTAKREFAGHVDHLQVRSLLAFPSTKVQIFTPDVFLFFVFVFVFVLQHLISKADFATALQRLVEKVACRYLYFCTRKACQYLYFSSTKSMNTDT